MCPSARPKIRPVRGPEHVPGQKLSVVLGGRWLPGGTEPVNYVVVIRGTARLDRKSRTVTFDTPSDAAEYFDGIMGGLVDVFAKQANQFDEYLITARTIVDDSKKHFGAIDLHLLLALAQVSQRNENSKYTCTYGTIAEILRDKAQIPIDPIIFRSWVSNCVRLIATKHKYMHKGVGKDTAAARYRFFKRAIYQLIDFGTFLKGSEIYLPLLGAFPRYMKDAIAANKEKLLARNTKEPLTKTEIENMLASDSFLRGSKAAKANKSLSMALFELQALAGGFRRGENQRLSDEHLIGNRVLLRNVNSKTSSAGNGRSVIPSPTASLALRVIFRCRHDLGFLLTTAEEARVENDRHSPTFVQLRTTCAGHHLFSGVGIEQVRELLGHMSLDMTVNHYLLHPVPDVGNLTPTEYYRNFDPFEVLHPDTQQPVRISDACRSEFEMYLLQKTVVLVNSWLKTNGGSTRDLARIVLEEADKIGRFTLPTGGLLVG